MTELNKIIREISKDIHNRIKISAKNITTRETKYVANRMKSVVAENRKLDTRLFKAIKYKLIITTNGAKGIIYADRGIAPYASRMITKGIPPASVKSWKKEKENIKRFIKKKQKYYGSFSDVKTERDLDKLTFFIWRKLRKKGVEPFNFLYLTILSLGGIEYYSARVFSKFNRSLKTSLRYAKKHYTLG